MAQSVLVITHDDDASALAQKLGFSLNESSRARVEAFRRWLLGVAMGTNGGASFAFNTGSVAASSTGTFTGAPTAAQTMTVNGVTLTARASGAVANEYNIGGSVTITAANLAAAINASTSAGLLAVTATSVLGVVTITAKIPGKAGNSIPTVDVDTANFTFAAAVLANGADGTQTTFSIGG